MAYLAAAMAASVVFVFAGWRSKQARSLTTTSGGHGMPKDALWDDIEIDLSSAQSQADAAGAIALALKRLAPVLASQFVQAEVAAPSGLLVRMRGAALADLLEELLAAAVHSAPASRLLLTAVSHGDHIEIGITDDMPGADPAVRMASMRGLMERVAMCGGALDVDVRPAEGTTMTLRLAGISKAGPDKKDRALTEPVRGAIAPLIPLMGR